MKKKILIGILGYFPAQQYGGQAVGIKNFCEHMGYRLDLYIVTQDHELKSKKRLEGIDIGWNDYQVCQVKYLSDSEYNYLSICRIIEEVNPDILYIQGLFAAKITLLFLKAHQNYKIPTILAPCGELCAGAFKKKYKKIPYLYLLRNLGLFQDISFQSTSEEEHRAIIKYIGADEARVYDLKEFPSTCESVVNQKKNALVARDFSQKKIVTLSRIAPVKNYLFALECMKRVDTEIIWDIYGTIEDRKYWEECKRMMNQMPSNIHVNFRGGGTA